MKRIITVLAVAALTAMMVAANAAPAFAKTNCDKFSDEPNIVDCRGGDGSGEGTGGGGRGGKVYLDEYGSGELTTSGGQGGKGGGSGGRCTGTVEPYLDVDCTEGYGN